MDWAGPKIYNPAFEYRLNHVIKKSKVFLSNNFLVPTKFQIMATPDSDTSVPDKILILILICKFNCSEHFYFFLIGIISEKLRFPLFNFRKN